MAIAGSCAVLAMLYSDTGPRDANRTDDVNGLIFDNSLVRQSGGEVGYIRTNRNGRDCFALRLFRPFFKAPETFPRPQCRNFALRIPVPAALATASSSLSCTARA